MKIKEMLSQHRRDFTAIYNTKNEMFGLWKGSKRRL